MQQKETQQHNARFSSSMNAKIFSRKKNTRETHTGVGNLFGVNAHKQASVLNCILRRLIGTTQVSPAMCVYAENVSKQLINELPSAISFNVWRVSR